MALSARMTNFGGGIVAEKRFGSRRYHRHDALGSVTALVNDAGSVTDTYQYWPYGEVRASTGSTSNPWKFCGWWGYYTDSAGRTYVRARTLRTDLGRWNTEDSNWPAEFAYGYSESNPESQVDPSGDLSLKPTDLSGRVPWGYSCHGSYATVVEIIDFPKKVGYVIQKVTATELNSSCKGGGKATTETYFEAWCVIKSGGAYRLAKGACNIQINAEYDIWAANWGSDVGSIVGKGEMVFMPGKPKDFDKLFKVGNVPRAGDLLSSKTFPTFPKKGEVTQTVDYKWSCCCMEGAKKRSCKKSFVRDPSMVTAFADDCNGNCPDIDPGGDPGGEPGGGMC